MPDSSCEITQRDHAGFPPARVRMRRQSSVNVHNASLPVGCDALPAIQYAACDDDAAVERQELNALLKIEERRAWLGCPQHGRRRSKLHSSVSQAMLRREGAAMWALVTPYYSCAWSLDKRCAAEQLANMRKSLDAIPTCGRPTVSENPDGGKWTCGLQEIGRSGRRCSSWCRAACTQRGRMAASTRAAVRATG